MININQGGGGVIQNIDPWEEELKKRMALAKSQGWGDEEINRSALVERTVRNRQQQQQAQQQAQQQVDDAQSGKTKGKASATKRFWVNAAALLGSTAAGVGAVAAAPFTGGASLAGGFAAGAGIEALRRKALGEEQSLGGSLVEGALTALPGVGQAKNLIRAGKVAKDADAVVDTARTARTVMPQASNSIDATKRTAEIVPKMQSRQAGNFTVDNAFQDGAATATQPGKKFDVKTMFQPSDQGVAGAPARFVERQGTNVRASGRGVQPGMKPDGEASRLSFEDAADRNAWLDANTKGGATRQLQMVGQRKAEAAAQIDDIITKNTKAVTPDDIALSQDRIKTNLLGNNGKGGGKFDPTNTQHMDAANNYARQMANITDSRGLLDFKRVLDKDINYSRNTMSPDPIGEQVATAFRREVDDKLKTMHPDLAAANKAYSQAQQAENALIVSKKLNPKGIAPFGTTVNGQGVGGNTAQRIQDFAGRMAQKTGRAGSTPAAQQLGMQFAGRAITGQPSVSVMPQPMDPSQMPQIKQNDDGTTQFINPATGQTMDLGNANDPSGLNDPNNQDAQVINYLIQNGYGDADNLREGLGQWAAAKASNPNVTLEEAFTTPGGAAGGSSGSGLGYSSSELFQAAINAYQAGDAKASDQYMQMAEFAEKYEQQALDNSKKANGGDDKLSAEASKIVANANSGLTSLQQLESVIQQGGGVPTGTLVPGRTFFGGFGANALGTSSYDTAARNVKDVITRLRTGAALTDSEEKFYSSQIPQKFDSPQVIQQKLQLFRELFQSVASRTGSSDFSDLSQVFQQQAQGAY